LIIDFHVHPFVDMRTILGEMESASVNVAVLLGVDVDPFDVDQPHIRRKLRNRHLASLFTTRSSMKQTIDEEVKGFFRDLASFYPSIVTSNEEIAQLARDHPTKFVGFGSVNPNKDRDYVETKLREIEALGLRGIKMLPTLQFFSPSENENFERICEFCEKKKRVLLYHTGCDPGPWENPEISKDANPELLQPVLETYHPTIVLAHAGSYSRQQPGIWLSEALALGKSFPNVFFDSSAVSSIIYSKNVLQKMRKEMGLQRLLYGSDYPVVWGSNMHYEVDVIMRCKWLKADEKADILGRNAQRILEL
jgi:predicted TIM-barrel fold metal-dependent hydrolase